MTYSPSDLPAALSAKIAPDAGGCWLWTASRQTSGYGQVRWAGTVRLAHRIVYSLLGGEIPDGKHLDHLCRVRHCVNPDHLEPVTLAENNRRAGAVKTHCPQGHEYTPENTITKRTRQGWRLRECRTCKNERRRKGFVK